MNDDPNPDPTTDLLTVADLKHPVPAKTPKSRAAYALPTLFTAGNIYLGFLSMVNSIQAAVAMGSDPLSAEAHFEFAAKTIGFAVLLDGLDGWIARMTGTTSDFGREMDSLADVISFGLAPAVFSFLWGLEFLDPTTPARLAGQLRTIGPFITFLFLLCGAARLARFNVQKNPRPKNPGRPDRKYFVGLPIPAAAGMVAAVVYASGSFPIGTWPFAVTWLLLLCLLAFLMVCTWRYYSPKSSKLMVHPRSPLSIIFLASLIFVIWNYSQIALIVLASVYVSSGVLVRFGGIIRHRLHRDSGHSSESSATGPTEQPVG